MSTNAQPPFSFPFERMTALLQQAFFAFDLSRKTTLYLSSAYEIISQLPIPNPLPSPRHLLAIVHPNDRRHLLEYFQLKEGRLAENIECRLRLPGDLVKWVQLTAGIFSADDETDVIAGSFTDITAARENRETLHHFADKKNSVLHLLAHDLLAPLSNISLSARLLAEEQPGEAGSTAASLLNIITQNCVKGVNLIQSLVNDEFLTTSKAQLVLQRVEMVEKLRTIINQFRQSPLPLEQRFYFECEPVVLYANVDEAKFTQIVTNLLSNAVKFTPAGGKITLRMRQVDNEMLIEVEDEGIGIPARFHPLLFDRFTKARRPGLNGEATTGLGMSIIRNIANWHNGRVWFESEEGKGSTFYVSIPLLS